MSPTGACSSAKRPPKLRAACNECHAAKVRCSGEKSGCQRCANLGLACVFSISRIGKVPGKRSKANRAAAAAAALAASTSSTSLSSSTSSTSLPSPTTLAPSTETLHSFRPFRHTPEDQSGLNRASHASTGFHGDSIISPVHEYPNSVIYPAENAISDHHLPLPDILPTPNAQHPSLPQTMDLGLGDLSQICWTTVDLDPLTTCNMLPTQSLEMPLLSKGPPALVDRRTSQPPNHHSHHPQDWDLDGSPSSNSNSNSNSNITSRQPITPPDFPFDPPSSPNYHAETAIPNPTAIYLHLLHDIDQTACSLLGQTLDTVLAANQRYLTTLLRLTETPGFARNYDTHLLFTVALSKIINLFSSGYRDFSMRLEGLIRFGVFEIDFVEQKAICRSILLRELKRAQICLGRLVDVLGRESCSGSVSGGGNMNGNGAGVGVGGMGRHELLCEEMRRRLVVLVGGLEGCEFVG